MSFFFFFFHKDWIAKKHCYTLPQHNIFDQLSAYFVPQTLTKLEPQTCPTLSLFSPFPLPASELTRYGEDLRAQISLSPLPHLSLNPWRVITFFIGQIIKGKPTSYISCSFAKLHAKLSSLFRRIFLLPR